MFLLIVLAVGLLSCNLVNAHLHQRVSNFKKSLTSHFKINDGKVVVEHFPLLKSISPEDAEDCYEPQVEDDIHIDIFNMTLVDLVENFFTKIHTDDDDTLEEHHRVGALLETVQELSEEVYNCSQLAKEERSPHGLTSMSAHTKEEFEKMLNSQLGATLDLKPANAPYKQCDFQYSGEIPKTLDWRKKGKMSPVLNQGKCGDCYIFAALAALESQYLIHEKPGLFSQQALLNCSPTGCKGGHIRNVWAYIMKNGAAKNGEFKYLAKQEKCRKHSSTGKVKDYCYVKSGSFFNDSQLIALLNKYGPLAGAIDATKTLKHTKSAYKGKCSTVPNHAVVIAGYTEKYWIIKNSWGTMWGEKGYFYLPRGQNKCGINIGFGVPFIQ